MRTRNAILLAAAGTGAALWGLRAYRRHARRIDLDGKIVVITGASSGHGLVVARQAAAGHADLVLAARRRDELDAAVPELVRLGARSVTVVPTDVRDESECHALIDQTIRRHGRIDILINNAGIIIVGPVESMTLDDFRNALATNFWGAVYCSLAAVSHMKRQGGGRIGNVVSIGGKAAAPHLLPYVASKFALTGFTEGLRGEVAKDRIYVTGIYPATMRTGGHAHAWFKGNPNAEFAWFAASDSLPLLSVSADHTARALWRAVLDGEAEVHVGWPTHLAAVLQNLFPNETAEIASIINQYFLPGPGDASTVAVQGKDLKGVAPSLFNSTMPAGTRPANPPTP